MHIHHFNELSRELRDIELKSQEQEDDSLLLNLESPDTLENFKQMKGLEHLAKLSIDDGELKR